MMSSFGQYPNVCKWRIYRAAYDVEWREVERLGYLLAGSQAKLFLMINGMARNQSSERSIISKSTPFGQETGSVMIIAIPEHWNNRVLTPV